MINCGGPLSHQSLPPPWTASQIFQRGNLAGVMPQDSRNFRTRTTSSFGRIAMSVRECSGTSIEHHTDSIAGLIVHLCPQVLQEMYDLFEINIRAERVSE
jgi:hypothetical protein